MHHAINKIVYNAAFVTPVEHWLKQDIEKWSSGSIKRNKGNFTGMKRQTAYEGRKEMSYLTTHSTHFIYGYMASDIIL